MSTHSQLQYPSSRPGTPPSSPSTQDTPSKKVLPDRERRVPAKAQPYKAELAKGVQARNDRQLAQKRKAEAEARPNSKPSGPIVDQASKRHKAGPSQVVDESVLSQSFDELTTDGDRTKWYQAAIRRRHGMDVDIDGLELGELKEMFDDPEATHDEITHSDDDMMRVVPAEDENGPPPGETDSPVPDHHVTPLARVDSSDYTTIMPGVPPNPKRGRDANGNRLPLTPLKTPDKGKQKAVPRPASLSGAQQRPKNAAPPPRFQESTSASSNEAAAPATSHPPSSVRPSQAPSAGSPKTPATAAANLQPATPKTPSTTGTNLQPATPSKPPKSNKPTKSTKPSAASPAKPSTSTPTKPFTTTPTTSSVTTPAKLPAAPTARSNPSTSASARNVATSSKAGGSSHTPTGGSGSRSQARKPAANESKPSKAGSSRSAKHLKTRHKGGKREEAPRGGDEEDEDSEEDDEDAQAVKAEDEVAMRQAAQLKKFGPLRWLVKAVSVRIKIRALGENPYADFTKRKPDEGGIPPTGYVLDEWLAEEWSRTWVARYPNDPVPKMRQEHVKWLYERFSVIRNEAKNAVGDRVDMYGLSRNNTPEQNRAIVKKLGLDGHLSPTLKQNDSLAFHHPIFEASFRKAYFSRQGTSFGYKNARCFRPIPKGLYGLFATVIYVLTQEFKTGEQVPSTLNAEDQLPWYNMFIEIYDSVHHNNAQRLYNKSMETFDLCYGLTYSQPAQRIEPPPREFKPDTQTVYVSRVNLPHTESDDEMSPEPEVVIVRGPGSPDAHPALPPASVSRSQSPELAMDEPEITEWHEPFQDGEGSGSPDHPVEELMCLTEDEEYY